MNGGLKNKKIKCHKMLHTLELLKLLLLSVLLIVTMDRGRLIRINTYKVQDQAAVPLHK